MSDAMGKKIKKPLKTHIKWLKTLVAMQVKNSIDASFLKSKRSAILKIGVSILSFALVTAAYYLVFYVCILLKVFPSGGGRIPDTVAAVLFTLIQIMSIASCTVGLCRSLYRSGDNVILLVLPVEQNTIFISKLIVYYVFELKRSLTLTLPLFLAYGISCGAVWFYYPWMIFCLFTVSFVPVAVGALLSIPALYIPKLLARAEWLKYTLVALLAGGVVWAAFAVVGLIPANIDLLAQWGLITGGVRTFLETFRKVAAPWYYLTRMAVGGTLAITRNPINGVAAITFGTCIASLALLIAISFATSRKLFFKMTAKAGETDGARAKQKRNKTRGKARSLVSEQLVMELRGSSAVWRTFVEIFAPAFIVFSLNKIYAAMDTSLSGKRMTEAFNVLVLLVTVLSSNGVLANLFSRDGAARNMLKTRPVDARAMLLARVSVRAVISTVSIIAAVALFSAVSGSQFIHAAGYAAFAVLINLAHILWCAEIDVMHPEKPAEGSNEAKATAIGVVLSILLAAAYYLLADAGRTQAFIKLACVALVFLALRTFLCLERAKIYFAEKQL